MVKSHRGTHSEIHVCTGVVALRPKQAHRGFIPMDDELEYHELVIDGTLDLHMFQPHDVKDLVPDYLQACREKDILLVRIVHGKGTGTLRRTVHSILEKMPHVVSFRLAEERDGGWGATLVELAPLKE